MDIIKLLNNDTSGLSEEEKFYADKFNDNLREVLMDELAIFECNRLIEDLKNNEELFREKIERILINGVKGYTTLPTKTLIDIYVDKCGEEQFINLIEKVSTM